MRANSSGWFSLIQRMRGIIHSALTPARQRASAGSPHSDMRRAWVEARVSIQRMAGPRGWPVSSSATSVLDVPSAEMARMSSGAAPARATASRTAMQAAAHQSAGFCSVQPGFGWMVG